MRAGRGRGAGRRRASRSRHPGVLEAIAEADVILFPPSNPVVSIGTILAVPGIREAIADAGVPVVGLSPIVGDAPVRGMADKVLAAVGVESHGHGGRQALPARGSSTAGSSTRWTRPPWSRSRRPGSRCRAVPLMMSDLDTAAQMAREALTLAEEVRES